MSRRRRSSSPANVTVRTPDPVVVSPLGGGPTFVVGLLLLVRYLLPAESAALGETVWVVQFWLLAAVVWLWLVARRGEPLRRWDWLDVAIGLLVFGPVLSAGIVLCTEGDRRAALNMLWEWIGIGVAAWMIRDVVRRERGRIRLLNIVVLAAITLSGLGLWQHHVWYPTLSEKLAEFDRLRSSAAVTEQDALHREDRLRDLQQELGPLIASADSTTSQLLRSRVTASTEPIGRFALANTFAGLLVVGLLLSGGGLLHGRAAGSSDWRWWAGAALVVGMAYCFWLTKSRTAWVGLLAGLIAWTIFSRRSLRWTRGVLGTLLAAGVLLILLPVIAGLSGGLDRQVVTEAPKSLQYRLEYWTATGAVIREAPWFGVGPGNFRQAYLAHKPPGSSEEVLDPHNLFLDVWANGGLPALVGLLLLTAILIQRMRQLAKATTTSESTDAAQARQSTQRPAVQPRGVIWFCSVGLVALGLAAFVSLMNGSGYIEGFWWLAAGWCLVSFLWPANQPAPTTIVAAAAVALIVHLMGAGGIAMPAIVQTLVLLAACVVQGPANVETSRAQKEWSALPAPLPWRPMLGAGVCLCLSIACAFTATLPVSAARTQTSLGRVLMAEGGNLSEAMRAFESAIEADPLAAEPWQELAMAHASNWQRMAGGDEAEFESAVQAQQEAIRLDPRASAGWQLLGDLWWLQYQSIVDVSAAQESLAAYEQAAKLYPHLASLQAKLSEAALASGETDVARRAAMLALVLDDANHQSGHVDKYLPTSTRTTLEAITGP